MTEKTDKIDVSHEKQIDLYIQDNIKPSIVKKVNLILRSFVSKLENTQNFSLIEYKNQLLDFLLKEEENSPWKVKENLGEFENITDENIEKLKDILFNLSYLLN
jgi:fructose-1-phosphate kinase PfkB-like protein